MFCRSLKVGIFLVLGFGAFTEAKALDLSVEEAVQQVLRLKSEVVNSRLDVEIRRSLYLQSYSPLFPVVQIGYQKNFSSMDSYKDQDLRNRYGSASIKQSLTAPFSKSYDIYRAKLQYDKARVLERDIALKKTTDIYELYFLICKLQEDQKVVERHLSLTANYLKIAKKRFSSGLIDRASKSRSDLLWLQLSNHLNELATSISVAKLELRYQLGLAGDTPLRLTSLLPRRFAELNFTKKSILEKLQRNDINSTLLAGLDLALAKSASKKAKLDLLPSLFVEYSYDHLVARKGEQPVDSKRSSTRIGVEWNIPVAGGDYFAFMAAKKAKEKSSNSLKDQRLSFVTRAFKTLQELQQLKAHHIYLKKYSSGLSEIAALSRQKFNRGLVDAYVVGQDIERQLTVEQNLNNVRFNVVQKVLELAFITSDSNVIQVLVP